MLDQPPSVAAYAEVQGAGDPRCLSAELARSLVTLRSRDGVLSAVIAPSLGGALVGLQWGRNGAETELLHRGMIFCPTPDFDGKAPTLWPATGRTYLDGASATPRSGWRWRGQDYAMPVHGFARDRAWRLVRTGKRAANEVVLRLDDDAASRAIYPFRFAMTTAYRVSGHTLTVRYRVTAGRNATAMPFSIGNHATFALPLGGRGSPQDTSLNTVPSDRVLLDAQGRPSGRMPQQALRAVPVVSLGRQTAVALAGYRGRTARAELTQPGWGTIAITHTASSTGSGDPVRFNLWGDAANGYFAVEPWVGLQNSLTTGEGLIRLAPGRTFSWTVTFRIDA